MGEPKRHHIVPEFYLRRFADAGKVELLKRSNLAESIHTSVENALVERHFYSIDTDEGRDSQVEKMLGSQVEPGAARAITRLVDEGRSLSLPGLRRAVSTFLAFQYVRGPAMRPRGADCDGAGRSR